MGNSVSCSESYPKNNSDTVISNKIVTNTKRDTKRIRADFIIKKDISCDDVKNNYIFVQNDDNGVSYILIKK